jgi:hypothetical protein
MGNPDARSTAGQYPAPQPVTPHPTMPYPSTQIGYAPAPAPSNTPVAYPQTAQDYPPPPTWPAASLPAAPSGYVSASQATHTAAYPICPAPEPLPVPDQSDPLLGRDYVVLIDRSGSMTQEDVYNSATQKYESRWRAAAEGMMALVAKVIELDPDGVDVCLFSKEHEFFHVTQTNQIGAIFYENEPLTTTNLSRPFELVLNEHFSLRQQGRRPKGTTIIVVTDGRPDNPARVTELLLNAANHCQHDKELGISFIQLGRDPGAQRYLTFLDDHLTGEGARYDIVDTKTWEKVEQLGFKKILLDALND